MLDVHLSELYGVETRVLKQAVKRNLSRFPEDFMYELNEDEVEAVVSQIVIPHKKHFGGAMPYAFTEAGVAMLSGVLKSDKAIEVNVAIIRTFIILRNTASHYKDIMNKLEQMRNDYDEKFIDIFTALDHLFSLPETKSSSLKGIGFKSD